MLLGWWLTAAGAGEATTLPVVQVQGSPNLGVWFGEAMSAAEMPWSVSRLVLDDTAGADRLESLASQLPGVLPAVTSAQMDTAIGMRGFTAARVYVDGLPDLRRRHVRDLSSLAVSEFLRGHASVRFANGSPAGVLALTLKAPDGVRRRDVEFDAGSGRFWRGSFDLGDQGDQGDLGGPADQTGAGLRWRLAGAAQEGDGWLASPAAFTIKRQALYAAASLPLGGRTTLRVDADLQHNARPYSFGTVLQQGQPVVDVGFIGPANAAERDYARAALRLLHELDAQNQLRLVVQNGHSERHEVMHGFYAQESAEELSGFFQQFDDRARQHDALLEWQNETAWPSGRLISRAGLQHGRAQTHFVGRQNIDGFRLRIDQPEFDVNPWTLPLSARLFRETVRETGGYAQSTLMLDSGWQFSAGLRQQHSMVAADRSGRPLQRRGELEALTSSLTALYRPTPVWSFWGNLGSSSDLNTGYDRWGQLLPERQTRQREIGSHWQPHPGGHVRLAVYVLRQSHLPETDPLDRSASVSSGVRLSRGLDLEAGWRWGDGGRNAHDRFGQYDGQLTAHFSLLHARQQYQQPPASGEPDLAPVGVPQRSGGLTWTQRLPGGGAAAPQISIALWGLAARPADAANTRQVPGFARIDLGLHWHWQLQAHGPWSQQSLRCSLQLRNAGDRRYVEAINAVDDAYPGQRRSLVLGVRASF